MRCAPATATLARRPDFQFVIVYAPGQPVLAVRFDDRQARRPRPPCRGRSSPDSRSQLAAADLEPRRGSSRSRRRPSGRSRRSARGRVAVAEAMRESARRRRGRRRRAARPRPRRGLARPNTALPATRMVAPAATTPRIGVQVDRRRRLRWAPGCRHRRAARAWRGSSRGSGGMKRCPPNPGLTDITSTKSTSPATSSIVATGVDGFSTTPAFAPSALMARDRPVQVRQHLDVHGEHRGAGRRQRPRGSGRGR